MRKIWAISLLLFFNANLAFSANLKVLIGEVQGKGFSSSMAGSVVTVQGVVTHVGRQSFFLQGRSDGNDHTSDAIIVFAKKYIEDGEVILGENYSVSGSIKEWKPFLRFKYKTKVSCGVDVPIDIPADDPSHDNARDKFMTLTEIVATKIQKSTPVKIGDHIDLSGKLSSKHYDDDKRTLFDPENDALDFWESVEGMRVKIPNAIAIGPEGKYDSVWVMSSNDYELESRNSQGGVIISPSDRENPQRIKVIFPKSGVKVNLGDSLGTLTGVVTYQDGEYGVLLDKGTPIPKAEGVKRAKSTIVPSSKNELSIASFNVENLSVDSKDSHFNAIADQLVYQMKAPDIIAVQEMGDDDGKIVSNVVSADATADKLINQLKIRGEDYLYFDLPPKLNCDGGKPGLNIRVAYFVKKNIAEAANITNVNLSKLGEFDSAFENTRKPLVLSFSLNKKEYVLLNVHLVSKRGDDGFMSSAISPQRKSEKKRIEQSKMIRSYLDTITQKGTRQIVLGDFNDHWFSEAVKLIETNESSKLWNTFNKISPEDRYSYVFKGNSQNLDQILVWGIAPNEANFSVLNINSPYWNQVSDHDPIILVIPR